MAASEPIKRLSYKQFPWFMLLAGLQGIVFAGTQYAQTGALSLPLDDSFIHFQYGKQITQGHYFQYQPQAPITSGATSFLYAHVMALGQLLGFQGAWAVLWSHWVAWFSLAFVLFFLVKIGEENLFPFAGWSASVFALFSGYYAWGVWSGMEIALFSALLMWGFFECSRTDFSWLRALLAWSALALCRPEGQIVAISLFGIRAVCAPIVGWEALRGKAGIAAMVLFFFSLIGPSLFFYWMTGEQASNTLVAKSFLHHPLMTAREMAQAIAKNFQNVLLFLLGDPSVTPHQGEYFLPGMLLFALLGCIGIGFVEPKGWGWRMYVFGLPLMLVFVAIATLEVWSLHNFRYFIPFYPLLILLAIAGIQTVLLFWRIGEWVFPAAIVALGFIMTLNYLPIWINRFAENAATIHEKQIQAARWIAQNLPDDRPIAINDAGALAYFSDKPVLDLVGLVSDDFVIPYRMGEGTLYERLQRIPHHNRPRYAALFPAWFKSTAQTFDIFHQPVITFPDPFDSQFQKQVFQINWGYDGHEVYPRANTLQKDWLIMDALDVADLQSEAGHRYVYRFKEAEYPEKAIRLRRNFGYHEEIDALWPSVKNEQKELIPWMDSIGLLPYFDIVDAGRRVLGGEEFQLNGLLKDEDAHLILRTCDSAGSSDRFLYRMDVFVDNVFAGRWQTQGTSWNWYEPVFTIPARFIQDSSVTIQIVNRGSTQSRYYESYYYWVCQDAPLVKNP